MTSIALSEVLREPPPARAPLAPPFPQGGLEAWAPRVPRPCRRPGALCRRGFPPGGRGRGAGVPNDSPALQPGEGLARAPLPHDRWGRAFGPLTGFKTFPRERKVKDPRLQPPPGPLPPWATSRCYSSPSSGPPPAPRPQVCREAFSAGFHAGSLLPEAGRISL